MSDTRVLRKNAVSYPFLFSICTIVNKNDEYAAMKNSFVACGFTEGCEYIIADNSETNEFDAYQAIAGFLKTAKGKYIVIVHQDVLCIDQKDQLTGCLENLNNLDANWAICGNAGGIAYHEDAMYINNAGKVKVSANLPARVMSLDENFLVIRSDANLAVSADLSGFHLYGTDLCLIADFLGYSAYVIPFMVKHLSYGNLKDLDTYIPVFVETYGRKMRARYVETTCTRFYLTNGRRKTKLYNSSMLLGIIKVGQRIKQLFRLAKRGDYHKKVVSEEERLNH
jgi:hypothetical protein